MANNDNVTLKVQIGSVAVEVTGSPEYAEKKLDELLQKYSSSRGIGYSVQPTPSAHVASAGGKGKELSPSEYIKRLAPKNQSEKALILAYYLEKHKGFDSFTTTELTDLGREAKQPRFTNISDTVSSQVQQGMLMGAGKKEANRAYALTTSGEEYVEGLIGAKQPQ